MKLFVWDFHGVLEKDNEKAVIVVSNKVLEKAGYKERFSEKDNEEFYGLKWYQYFERIIPGLNKSEYLKLQSDCYKYSEAHLDLLAKYIKPNDHAIEVLSLIIQLISKKYRKKKVFLSTPVHHHFEALGWPSYKVTMRAWLIGIVLAFIGVAVRLFR